MQPPIVFYHSPCRDGQTAAWVFRRKHPDADFRKADFGKTPLPADLAGQDVVLLDFTWPGPEMQQLCQTARSVLVLDHHASAEATLRQMASSYPHVVTAIFDRSRCGARLTWDYCYANRESPALIDFVEDRDLWRWVLDGSREANACIEQSPLTWESWDRLALASREELIAMGRPLLAMQEGIVRRIAAHQYPATLLGTPVIACNAPLYQSEVGSLLAHNDLIAVVWYHDRDGRYRYSLRSSETGPDVTILTQQFGGGGHPHAGGFLADTLVVTPR